MTRRARAIALRRRQPPWWLPWLVLASLLVAGTAFGQTKQQDGQSANPPASPPPAGTLPPASMGRGSDTPGGSATNGVIQPPAVDPGMAKPTPPTDTMSTPVIRPPGQSGGRPVVPK
jgi:hypothetical protein